MNNNKVFLWSLVISLGGFLFGFDTAVISGAEREIQAYWALTEFEHGVTMSIALIGTVLGALVGAIPSDNWGRKKALLLIASLYLVSAIGTALAHNWVFFLTFRLLGGVGVGISSVTAPIYISEISPPDKRGRLVGLFQFNIVLGILISYLSNYMIGQMEGETWRYMLGVQAFPSILFFVLIKYLPESPRWLIIKKGNLELGKSILEVINPTNSTRELEVILNSKAIHGEQKYSVFKKDYNKPLLLAILFAVFNQVSGINAIIYYAPRVFEMAGLGSQGSLLSTVGIGLVNFIFTLLALSVIDQFGRRKLMLFGTIGIIFSLLLVSYSFHQSEPDGILILVCLMFYIAFFALSQGAVIWVFIAEIFPNVVRAQGQTLGSLTHWVMAVIITFCFPMFSSWLGGSSTFLIFAFFMIGQLVFVLKYMPETKKRSLEQLQEANTASINQ
ncbi:sugar porter family MFS transporter [Sphingobacterium faecale]|uniref:Sugar porter family MFS transporter n=1 Tax=Sphingobacterium faecale TaxID=2803775 RepID=A0ABS1R4J0_9SPHI|nr:sugar porter family MFS transporter [Sphingobacterium faecale]MBL1408746.1 sugar porter family MFS transporter [Sphingobacterium faecale]